MGLSLQKLIAPATPKGMASPVASAPLSDKIAKTIGIRKSELDPIGSALTRSSTVDKLNDPAGLLDEKDEAKKKKGLLS